jgi:hypothetical protein
MIELRGPGRIFIQPGSRHYATFGSAPFQPPSHPSAIFSTGLEGFRVGAAMSGATLSAAETLTSLVGSWYGLGVLTPFVALAGVLPRGPAFQTTRVTVNGRTTSYKQIYRNIY